MRRHLLAVSLKRALSLTMMAILTGYLERQPIGGAAEGYSRKNGTLQKDWCIIKSNQLSDAFCIAVRGHKGWGGLFKAKYSLVVSFEAINQDIPIYEPIRTEIELAVENGEVEVEMPIPKL